MVPVAGSGTSHQAEGESGSDKPEGDQNTPRHVCHCGKAFIRKEHLRRHQATHGERTFICQLCQRSFTRNDLLRRHMTRHDLSSGPDTRRGRACDACHANKTKCDGGTQCSLCAKRNIACTYKLAQGNNKGSTDPEKVETHSLGDSTLLQSSTVTEDADGEEDSAMSGIEVEANEGASASPSSQGLDLQQSAGVVSFSTVLSRLIKKIESPATPLDENVEFTAEEKEWLENNTEHYFGRFHETWPVFHGPTFWIEKTCLASSTTLITIAAWLKHELVGHGQSIPRIHKTLTARFIQYLSSPRTRDQVLGRWPIDIYESILLNIIFSLHLGSEDAIASASVLRGMFVASLREIDFFTSDVASEQQTTHFPGTFLPYVQTYREMWKRIVTSLYKVDTYLAIVRDNPPFLHREELDVSLTSTYSLWNCYGLDIFFKRLPNEPSDRAGFKLSEVLANARTPARSLLLIEDVQLGFCGLNMRLWHHAQVRRRGTGTGPQSVDSQASLAWHLECWKDELKRVSSSCIQSIVEGRTNEFPFIAYLGRGDEDPGRCKMIAISQIKSLASETLHVYHIEGIQLYSDLKTIRAVANYVRESSLSNNNLPPRIQKYLSQLKSWVGTPDSRKALLHAIAVLEAREQDTNNQDSQLERPLNPIAHVAACLSAMVLWAWVMFAEQACSCIPGRNHVNIGVDPPDLQSTAQLETWIQAGGTAALHGIAVCRCLVDGWMRRFAATLPQADQEWELGYSIAPVLRSFRQGSS